MWARNVITGRLSAAVVLVGAFVALAPTGSARPLSVGTTVVPLSVALRADGSLATRSGTFDARGYRLLTASDGSPRFSSAASTSTQNSNAAATTTSNAGWDTRFPRPGVDGNGASSVDVVTVSGTSVYVGGDLTKLPGGTGRAGGNIVRWDGRNWSSLGSGTNGTVLAISVLGTRVYAGGTFTAAGGVAVSMVAMFDGTRWHDLAGGVSEGYYYDTNPHVGALAATANGVYVAGAFDHAGGVAAKSIAFFDGTTWRPLGAGIGNANGNPGQVAALLLSGSTLYTAGTFDLAGGVATASIARWDGTAWSGLSGPGVTTSSGFAGQVTSLLLNGTSLFVGGRFANAGGVPAVSVARYDGTAWHALAQVTQYGYPGLVSGLSRVGATGLLVTGQFDAAGGSTSPNAALWNGNTFTAAGPGLDGGVVAAATSGTGTAAVSVLAGGFTNAGPIRLTGLAFYGPKGYTSFGYGVDNAVTALAASPSAPDVWAAGPFSQAGSVRVQNLAHWTGKTWVALPGTTNGVRAMAPYGAGVFVGGGFTAMGTVAANDVAYYDGTTWSALGAGLDGPVESLLVYGGKLFVGGQFLHAGGVPADSVASWDLTTHRWSALGGNLTYSNSGGSTDISALTAAGNSLFIGGTFNDLFDPVARRHLAAPYLIRYDLRNTSTSGFAGYYYTGTDPTATNNGPSGPVTGLAVTGDGQLYAVGGFTAAGGQSAAGVGRFSLGTQAWSNPAGVSGGSALVRGITVAGPDIYVIGDFTAAGGLPAATIARYSPATDSWGPLGSGLTLGDSGQVLFGYALAQTSVGLFAGGVFDRAGSRGAENIAWWTPTARITAAETANPTSTTVGSSVTFTTTLRSVLGAPTMTPTVTETLPPGVAFSSVTPSLGSCTHSAQTVTCALGPMTGGSSATVRTSVTAVRIGTWTDVVSVSPGGATTGATLQVS